VCVRQIFGRAAPRLHLLVLGVVVKPPDTATAGSVLVGMEIELFTLGVCLGGPMVGEIFILLFVAAILLS
jgi:hypothetical protein